MRRAALIGVVTLILASGCVDGGPAPSGSSTVEPLSSKPTVDVPENHARFCAENPTPAPSTQGRTPLTSRGWHGHGSYASSDTGRGGGADETT